MCTENSGQRICPVCILFSILSKCPFLSVQIINTHIQSMCQLSVYPINSATVHMSTESVHCPFIDRTVPLSICSHKVSTVHVSKEQCPQSMCPQNSVHCPCVQITVSIVHISIEQFQLSIYPHKSALCPCVNRSVTHPMCPQNSNTFNVSIKQCHPSIF